MPRPTMPPVTPLPPPLQAGDRVRLVAASSALVDAGRLEAGIACLRDWGLQVEPAAPALVGRRWGYLAGRDDARADDFFTAPGERPPALHACVRGGWGSARLLERDRLIQPEGWLLGFSDVTSLLWSRLAQGLGGGIHGPLITTLAGEPPWSRERLRRLLFGEPLPPLTGEVWAGGQAEGPLLVANLTVATHLLGTAHLPALTGAILVLEDVGEAPYRIERMLTHWRLSGALAQLGGLAFGSFLRCEDPDRADEPAEHHFSLEQVLRERCLDLGIPVLAGLPVGHAPGNAALPLGVPARLDGDRGRLELLA
ncbi:MAG: LD-carboxypeptidase [Synechococcaceae cyanobacterium]|nr:LD-carboxypeptidase [Synechococcaceae cyanobacterium]